MEPLKKKRRIDEFNTGTKMGDDIDIEEHDVMDNPIIKSMFPDLSIIKREIQDFDGAFVIKQEPDELEPAKELVDSYIKKSNNNMQPTTLDPCSSKNFSTTTILNSHTHTISPYKEPLVQNVIDVTRPIHSNKIIIGSKPVNSLQIVNKKEKQSNHLLKVHVLLENIHCHLIKSERYCSICLILFPNKLIFDHHNKNIHLCNRKLSKSNYNNNSCFHCDKIFSMQKDLIEHLYNLLQSKQLTKIDNYNHIKKKTDSDNKNKKKTDNDKKNKKKTDNDSSNKKISLEKKSTPAAENHKQIISKTILLKKESVTKLYSCSVCSQYFKNSKSYQVHMSKKHSIVKYSEPKKVPFNPKCRYCSSKLTHMSSYNIHIWKFHKNRLFQDTSPPKKTTTIIRNKNPPNAFYKCSLCSYYFSNIKKFMTHMVKSHKVKKHIKKESVSFDPSCIYCSSSYRNVKSYNAHLKNCRITHRKLNKFTKAASFAHIDDDIYSNSNSNECNFIKNEQKETTKSKEEYEAPFQNSITNIKSTEDTLVLKEVLFKCNKCDIHFMSAVSAIDHTNHIEVLINWKCLLCQKIFKKKDEPLHRKQHSLCNNFVVYNLCKDELSVVLYKCLKCAVHFTENKFILHFPVCGVETPDSVYCRMCDILVDSQSYKLHEYNHSHAKSELSDFKIVEANVLMIGSQEKSNNKKSRNKLKRKRTETDEDSSDEYPKRMSIVDMVYCNTCKCYLPYYFNHKVHVQSRCTHMTKYFCKSCGLQFTQKSIVGHKRLHKRMSNLKLQDFRIYNIRNKKQIRPPLPEFPYCSICYVHFLSKNETKDHICREIKYFTCSKCEIKLSETAHNLHISFHEYFIKKTASSKLSEIDDDTLNNIDSPHSSKKVLTQESIVNVVDLLSEESETNVIKSSQCAGGMKLPQHAEVKELPQNGEEENSSQSETLVLEKEIDLSQTKKTECKQFEIIYLCKNCNVALDGYDTVVEHCQNHYTTNSQSLITENCDICALDFHKTCIETHKDKHLHKDCTRNSIKILKFDIFYFALDNRTWLKHIFGSLSREITKKITNESVYKFERKIKLEIIQEGLTDFTVFNCEQCQSFVDPKTIYKHVHSCNPKIRKWLCSVCGLPFVSSVSRLEHEKIHDNNTVSFKSYKIAVFNREGYNAGDNINYLHNQYVLFQCRNCNGVVDKNKFRNHTCDRSILKKCLKCGLLIHDKDYDCHIFKHNEFDSFVSDNMKVILYSENDNIEKLKENDTNNACKKLASTYNGVICDYTYYRCFKCEVCVKNVNYMSNHVCSLPTSQFKCKKCDLIFSASKMKYHRSLHENDPHFVRGNMKIIPFNSMESAKIRLKETKENNLEDSILTHTTTKLNDTDDPVPITEEVANIYKCHCGLHFLTETCVYTHLEICNPKLKVAKQNCSKCDLLFTPKILFNHLLTHHGNKNYNYKFNIINISKNVDGVLLLYKCYKCQCNFVKKNDAIKHKVTCEGTTKDIKECCTLKFNVSNFNDHQNLHHDVPDNFEKKYKIIDVDEHALIKNSNIILERESKIILNEMLTDGDMVTDKRFNISGETLSKIDVNNYTNTVYRCKECGLHFLSKTASQKHLQGRKHHNCLIKAQDICEVCGLNFTLPSLIKHVYVHHEKLNLKAEDVIVKDFSNNIEL